MSPRSEPGGGPTSGPRPDASRSAAPDRDTGLVAFDPFFSALGGSAFVAVATFLGLHWAELVVLFR